MELQKIQAFLINHTGAKFFAADVVLFKQKFPASPLIPELDRVETYNIAQLDERICYELLQEAGICDCVIWENRGFTIDKDGFIVPMKKENEPSEDEKILMTMNLNEKQVYNELKALLFAFELTVDNQKEITIIEALKAKQIELNATYNPAALTAENAPKTNEGDLKLSSRGNVLVDQSEKDDSNASANDTTTEGNTSDSNTNDAEQPNEEEKKSEGHDTNTPQ